MAVTVFTSILLILAVLVGIFAKWTEVNRRTDTPINKDYRWVAVIPLVLAFVVFGFGAFARVPENSVGVVVNFSGKVDSKTLPTGFHFKYPWQDVVTYDYQTELFSGEELGAGTKDLQQVGVLVKINWQLRPEYVTQVYKELRGNYVAKILNPAIQESVKATTARFTAAELIEKRAEVRDQIAGTLRDKVDSFETCPSCLRIIEVNIESIAFSETFDASIEAKVKAEQQAQEAKNITVRIQEEAKQQVVRAEADKEQAILVAEGHAQSILLAAQAEAESISVRAEAQANANKELINSLGGTSDDYIRFLIANGLEIKTVVLPAGTDFILGPEVLGE